MTDNVASWFLISMHPQQYQVLRDEESHHNYESLDFTETDNTVRRDHDRVNTISEETEREVGKWLVCFAIGVVVGLMAIAVRICVEAINETKFELAYRMFDEHGWLMSFLVYWTINLIASAGAYFFVFFFGNRVSSSGIPEVMGYLNGVRVEKTFNILTFLAKAASLILSFSSSLVLGPEGPMIHLGATVGAALSQMKSKTLGMYTKFFWKYRNDTDKRDFISCGAAAGMSAAFGAPIGGVIFAIEEASTYWSKQLTWRTFFCCMVAAFTVNVVNSVVGYTANVDDFGLITFGFSNTELYRYTELFVFAILGVCGGCVGTAFIQLNVALNQWRSKYLHQRHKLVMLGEVLTIVTLTSMLCFGLPFLFPCRSKSDLWEPIGVCSKATEVHLVETTCKGDYFNDLASMTYAPSSTVLPLVFSRVNGIFSIAALMVFGVIFFILAVITSGTWVAGGLFIPMMMIGACIGRLVGRLVIMLVPHVQPPIDPSIYALVGSVAVMTGFCRMTISIVVVYAELTETTQFLLPVILAVMISKWTADFFGHSIYEQLLETKGMPFMHHHQRKQDRNEYAKYDKVQTVADVMTCPVVTFGLVEKVEIITDALRNTTHNGFPVISRGQEDDCTRYEGLILRKQLLILLGSKQFVAADEIFAVPVEGHISASGSVSQAMSSFSSLPTIDDIVLTPPSDHLTQIPISYREFNDLLVRKLPTMANLHLTNEERGMYLDLRPYFNHSALFVGTAFSFEEAYKIVMTMGLRHLPIVDHSHRVVGILTRKDLINKKQH